jgi:hypothetical protein
MSTKAYSSQFLAQAPFKKNTLEVGAYCYQCKSDESRGAIISPIVLLLVLLRIK